MKDKLEQIREHLHVAQGCGWDDLPDGWWDDCQADTEFLLDEIDAQRAMTRRLSAAWANDRDDLREEIDRLKARLRAKP